MTMTTTPRVAFFSPASVLSDSLASSTARAGMDLTVIRDGGTQPAVTSAKESANSAPLAQRFDHLVFAPRFPSHHSPIESLSSARLEKTFEGIYWSFFRFVKACVPALRDNGKFVVLLAGEADL